MLSLMMLLENANMNADTPAEMMMKFAVNPSIRG